MGTAVGHHGELLQGVFHDRFGVPRRGLVTLPLNSLGSIARFRAGNRLGAVSVSVFPTDKSKARRAAELAVQYCAEQAGEPLMHGHLETHTLLESGLGMGASTSDVVAAIRAVATCYRVELLPAEVGRLSVLAEQASDSIMIEDRVVLFAQREGIVLEHLGDRLPPTMVVGCLIGFERTVDTLALQPAEYDADELARFRTLLAALRHGVRAGDIRVIGRVATASARMNQRLLPKPELESVIEISAACGAAGVQIAHSGSVAGVIFDPTRESTGADVERCVTALDRAGVTHTRTYTPAMVGTVT